MVRKDTHEALPQCQPISQFLHREVIVVGSHFALQREDVEVLQHAERAAR